MYKMLDLFSGEKGASSAMLEDPNWEVITVEINPDQKPTICMDILEMTLDDLPHTDFDLVWASPPCNAFSIASSNSYWRYENDVLMPTKEMTLVFMSLVFKSLSLIEQLNPDWWFMENPRGILPRFIGEPSGLVTYCQYGETYMKPTYLWGKHPPSFKYKKCWYGDNCHEAAPRSSKTGIQGLSDASARAKVPYLLSKSVKEAVENPKLATLFDFASINSKSLRIDQNE
jgi:hypothetical protein